MTSLADRDPLHREIAKLRDQVETLEAAAARWAEIWAPLAPEFPPAWVLRRQARRVLAALMRRSPNGVSNDALLCAASGDVDPPERSHNLIRVYICRIRDALAAHIPGAEIETVWGEGYRLPAASKALIEAAIEAAQ